MDPALKTWHIRTVTCENSPGTASLNIFQLQIDFGYWYESLIKGPTVFISLFICPSVKLENHRRNFYKVLYWTRMLNVVKDGKNSTEIGTFHTKLTCIS